MASIHEFPQVIQQRLQSELKAGETISWVGQPNPTRYMRDGFKLWLFFIPWTAFALFWMAGASGFEIPTFENGQSFFPLFGLPFLFIGIGGLSSPFLLRRKAGSIVYAITNQRAIIIEGARSVTVKSYFPKDLKDIERIQHADGSGDLILGSDYYRDSDGDRQVKRRGFLSIPDVRTAENMVEGLVKRATP